MIPRRTRGSPGQEQSPLEQKYRNLLQTRFQAAGFGASAEALAKLDGEIAELKARIDAPKRARTPPKPRTEPSEAEILKDIMKLLHVHPKVAKAWRVNSGVAKYQSGEGTRYVRMNTAKGMSDVMGVLKDGRTLAIECKSRTGTVHAHQHEFLNSISAAGGVAFVARSVSDVLTKLEAA